MCGGDLKARDRYVIMRHPQLYLGVFSFNYLKGDGYEQEDEWS